MTKPIAEVKVLYNQDRNLLWIDACVRPLVMLLFLIIPAKPLNDAQTGGFSFFYCP
jgi:hypothetical protein